MSDTRPENLSAAEALELLKAGNQRFMLGRLVHPHSDPGRRQELVQGQQPFATVITCADSRVPVELLFDQGLGDLFVIRVAGNIADDAVLGSVEYASLHLGVNLIAVMGHRSCGAVAAAVDTLDIDGPPTNSHIDALIDAIRPAVQMTAAQGSEDLLERSVQQNAMMVADQIRHSEPVLAGLGTRGVEVWPAYYDLESGEVRGLP